MRSLRRLAQEIRDERTPHQRHRACDRGGRARRPVPRRGGGAPSGGRVDRHRRAQRRTAASRSPRRSAPTSSPPITANCSRGRRSTCAIIATDEHLHVDPVMCAVERGLPMLIEKPLATTLEESARVLEAIEHSGVDAVVGYTQRFRRRWLAAKEKVPHRRARRRDAGHLARLHEPPGRHRQLQAHRRAGDDLAHGDLRHPRARHLHVVSRRQDAGRSLRPLGRQGAGPALSAASTPPPA